MRRSPPRAASAFAFVTLVAGACGQPASTPRGGATSESTPPEPSVAIVEVSTASPPGSGVASAGATEARPRASAAASAAAVVAAPGAAAERLGGVAPGADEATLIQAFGAPLKKSTPQLAQATGEFQTSWTFKDGVSAMLSGTTAKGPFHADLVIVAAPSKLRTAAGIGLGATRAEVERAYGPAIDREISSPERIVVGELFGGLKLELDKAGKVRSLSLGSDGE